MKTKLFVAALAATALVPAAAQAQRVPAAVVAVVDTDQISQSCTACRAASTSLQSQETTLRQRAATLQQQIQTAGGPLQQQVAALNGKEPDAALKAKITAFQNQQRSAQQELEQGQQRLASTQANVNQQISAKLQTIVASVSASRGANVTIAKADVMFAAPSVDITSEVLAQLNQQLPAVSVTPLPQSQQQTQGR
ncbi:OmpH family outer membrane protein [Sphingomonas sp. KRR8]|uniref:OmpH family outer membrane protein n=1 Tax=Sphingomonas sp. KRR8 TaxID=2942996 RepID=UPI002021E066|nr:OmpH family outer membrane protein [Sphingomonas sp. KRR8]URD61641.1 OmpH family outer membrane protein [Sphingomonas sp. KRR8]